MGYCREKASKLLSRLGRKLCPTIVPLSRCSGSPAPQTSLIFELPNELILSILSHICPDPQLTGHYARFCIPYSPGISDCYNRRVRFLRPLSMTCKAMRLRLLPWVWERLELPPPHPWITGDESFAKKLDSVVNALHIDIFLAANVKFMTMYLPPDGPILPSFVKCLESLPNLHTLEIWGTTTPSLKKTLKGIKLPQIKTLIIPPTAHPLLRHCHNVEDVVCVVKDNSMAPDSFLGSLASNRDSKVKRLAIPLDLWTDPSRIIAACPRLAELTISPSPHSTKVTETGISELVIACKALPDFDTLQVLYFVTQPPRPMCWCGTHGPSKEQWEQSLKDQANGMRDSAIDCLKSPNMGSQVRQKRKRTTVRVIRLNSARPRPDPGSVKVEEYEV